MEPNKEETNSDITLVKKLCVACRSAHRNYVSASKKNNAKLARSKDSHRSGAKEDITMTMLSNYVTLCRMKEITFEDDHKQNFICLYEELREDIELILTNEEFLRKSDVEIWWRKEDPVDRKKYVKIPLGNCINEAISLRVPLANKIKALERKLKDVKDDRDESEKIEAEIVDIKKQTSYVVSYEIEFYLISIIIRAIEDSEYADDIPDLQKIASSLEHKAYLSAEQKEEGSESSLGALVSNVMGLTKQMGLEGIVGSESVEDVTGVLGNIMGEGKLFKTLGDALKEGTDKASEGGDLVSNVFDKIKPMFSEISSPPPGVEVDEKLRKKQDASLEKFKAQMTSFAGTASEMMEAFGGGGDEESSGSASSD